MVSWSRQPTCRARTPISSGTWFLNCSEWQRTPRSHALKESRKGANAANACMAIQNPPARFRARAGNIRMKQ
jgi:hypothetical protein